MLYRRQEAYMKFIKRLFLALIILVIAGAGALYYIWKGGPATNRNNYERIGSIPPPKGYERIPGSDPAFTAYLRSLPLKPKGSRVMLFTGGKANLQATAYAVVDLPLLSNDEQCADCCMRLRGEYLYQAKRYGDIRFNDVNGKALRYEGGASRKSFERYMRRVYGVASTYSLSHSLPRRELCDIEPGDVFVFTAGSIKFGIKTTLGHAIMVADVAENSEGRKVFLLVEGSTPAQDIHVMRNFTSPFRSPWYSLDDKADRLMLSALFEEDELRHW